MTRTVSAIRSPWWDRVMSEIVSRPGMVGSVVCSDDLPQIIPPYPDGRQVRARAATRRLRRILRLVERGPNGSLSNGAKYEIVGLPSDGVVTGDEIVTDDDWITEAIDDLNDE